MSSEGRGLTTLTLDVATDVGTFGADVGPPPHLTLGRRAPTQVGGGGRGTSTLGRYVGNVHCRGPTFPFERAFTTVNRHPSSISSLES